MSEINEAAARLEERLVQADQQPPNLDYYLATVHKEDLRAILAERTERERRVGELEAVLKRFNIHESDDSKSTLDVLLAKARAEGAAALRGGKA